MSRDRRKHSPAFKAKALLEFVKGDETVAHVDAKYEVRPRQIQAWKNSLLEGAAGVFGNGQDQEATLPRANRRRTDTPGVSMASYGMSART